ncbi:MAG: hypothetical protein SD837_21135 [Candidatus Electrothrix scaldis]|nr:MAG: hypothetical protein SD837_21135 [Candidatus Electrothrix sp. GW3-3]
MAEYLLISAKKSKGCNLLIFYGQVMRLPWVSQPWLKYFFLDIDPYYSISSSHELNSKKIRLGGGAIMKRIYLSENSTGIFLLLLAFFVLQFPLTANAESEAQKVCKAVSGSIQKICDTGVSYPTSVKMCRETIFEPLSCKTKKTVSYSCPKAVPCKSKKTVSYPCPKYDSCKSKKTVSYSCPKVDPCKTEKCTTVRYPCGVNCNWKGCKTRFCKEEKCVCVPGTVNRTCKKKVCVPGTVNKTCKKEVCVPGTVNRTCKEEVCVPGTREKNINIPCGLSTDKISICDDRISPKIKDTLKVAGVGCNCMDSLSKFLDDGLDKVMNSGEVNQATSKALTAFAEMSQCITDQGFSVKDNKDEVTKKLSDTDKFFILAPEIGQRFYIDFVVRAVGCAYGDCDTLINLFVDYFQETKDQTIVQLKNFDKKLNTRVVRLKDTLEDTVEIARTIGYEFKQSATGCATSEAYEVRDALRSLENIAGFGDRVNDFNRTLRKIERLLNQLEQVSSALDSIDQAGYKEQLLQAIATGKLPNLSDPLDFIKNLDELRKMGAEFSDLGRELPRVSQILTDAERAISKIRSIASAPQALKQCLSSRAETKFNNDVKRLNEKVAEAKKIVDGFKISKVDISAGSMTYQRWTDVSFDVPCSKKGKKCLKAAGFKECLEYPMLYSCKYEKRIPFPNHHIPYLQIKLN